MHLHIQMHAVWSICDEYLRQTCATDLPCAFPIAATFALVNGQPFMASTATQKKDLSEKCSSSPNDKKEKGTMGRAGLWKRLTSLVCDAVLDAVVDGGLIVL